MFITAVIETKNYCEHSQYTEYIFERDLSSQQKLVRRTQYVFGRYHGNERCPTRVRVLCWGTCSKNDSVYTHLYQSNEGCFTCVRVSRWDTCLKNDSVYTHLKSQIAVVITQCTVFSHKHYIIFSIKIMYNVRWMLKYMYRAVKE